MGRTLAGQGPGVIARLGAGDDFLSELFGVAGTLAGHGADGVSDIGQQEIQILGAFESGVVRHSLMQGIPGWWGKG